jgi:hypothetical protein
LQLCVTKKDLVLGTNGKEFFWPIRMDDRYSIRDTLLSFREKAYDSWIQLDWDGEVYRLKDVQGEGSEEIPVFSERPLDSLLEEAFEGKVISTLDHVVAKNILGRGTG